MSPTRGRSVILLLALLLVPDAFGKSLTALANAGINSRVALRFSSSIRAPPAASPKPALEGALVHPTNSPITEAAMPLIRVVKANQTLAVEHTAMHSLASLPGPICVLGMTGTARDGKSTFLNMFAHWLRSRWSTGNGQGASFPVGHDLDTCTDGAWIRIFQGRGENPSAPPSLSPALPAACPTGRRADLPNGCSLAHQHALTHARTARCCHLTA